MHRLLLNLSLGLSLTAFAQPQPPRTPERTAPRPVQHADFIEGSDIHGARAAPLGQVHVARPQSRFKSLLQVRTHFDDKLRESVFEFR
ncbi:MAG: hypothetical protein INH41_01890 [Myxococcaceae bacterium]|jgi:hypothetical protein|nr:hypothetical protein [Myxococcaceae bacterium]MCA3011129.1 hypothetical protein [Myxococcaceae bacterium]